VKSGRIRAYGVASSKRSPALPDVPAINESLKGFEADNWFGLMMPAGTPREIVVKLNAEMVRILEQQFAYLVVWGQSLGSRAVCSIRSTTTRLGSIR
jgi:hypothetical protein